MGCHWFFMAMRFQWLELEKSGPGHLYVFPFAPCLPMHLVVPWVTSSCMVGLSSRSFVSLVLKIFWVPWTLSSRSCSGPLRPCTWEFGGRRYRHSTPAGRKAGTPLAGGYFGVLLQLSGDLDHFTKWLGLPQSTTHSKPCALCRAQYSGANSWLDMGLLGSKLY